MQLPTNRTTLAGTFCAVFLSLFSSFCFAQRTNSFVLGADYVKYGNPREWNDGLAYVRTTPSVDIMNNIGLWAAYYYKNKYSLRAHLSGISQSAEYYKEVMPDNFLVARSVEFCDFTVGYNVLQPKSKLAGWVYAGVSYIPSYYDEYTSYTDIKVWSEIGSNRWVKHIARPVVQAMLKYNPIRYVFVGIGGTYHYIFSDVQPISFNVSVGVEF